MALIAKTIHIITVFGTYRVEAKSSQDAFAKAREYYEDNINQLTMSGATQTVYVEEREDKSCLKWE